MRANTRPQDIGDRQNAPQSMQLQWRQYSDGRPATLNQRVAIDCGTDDEELSHVAVLGYN